MTPAPTRAIYARVPPRVADKLDRVAARLGRSKQDLLATLVSDHLTFEDVLNLAEAAELLRVSEDDLQALAESGELPGRRISSEWRFSRQALLHWLGGST
jgi:excisionase family DNA binding protein